VAVRSKEYVCGRLIDGMTGSNPAEGSVVLLCLFCVVSVAVSATTSYSLVQRIATECESV
jgi:hypothetical protein